MPDVEQREMFVVERDAGVVTVTLDRPERKNAVTMPMWPVLRDIFTEVAHCTTDRVLVLTGAGNVFCSGADLAPINAAEDHWPGAENASKDPADSNWLAMMRVFNDAVLQLHRLPKPTIAKVRGVAVGAGCNLALTCDLIVASPDAVFSEIFTQRAMSVDGGASWILPRLIGLHRAKELCFFAEKLSAEQAHQLGILNHVLAADDLDAFVDDWAARLAAGPPIALSMTKMLFNKTFESSMDQALENEACCQVVNFGTRDTAEAIKAFKERRTPVYRGW